MTYYPDTPLPSIEQAQEFLRLINVGREAIGLDALESLDFDACQPGATDMCLSATHLFCTEPVQTASGECAFVGAMTVRSDPRIYEALDTTIIESDCMVIPEAILAVTDPFDDRHPGLRGRLVEAGVVEDTL